MVQNNGEIVELFMIILGQECTKRQNENIQDGASTSSTQSLANPLLETSVLQLQNM